MTAQDDQKAESLSLFIIALGMTIRSMDDLRRKRGSEWFLRDLQRRLKKIPSTWPTDQNPYLALHVRALIGAVQNAPESQKS